MTTDIEEALDWHGNAIDCGACRHSRTQATGGCRSMHSCVMDRYARRIDRFFSWNPTLANEYLHHPYFEVRAAAAKYADLFHLTQLLSDVDETVRWSAAQRRPPRYLRPLCN